MYTLSMDSTEKMDKSYTVFKKDPLYHTLSMVLRKCQDRLDRDKSYKVFKLDNLCIFYLWKVLRKRDIS